VAERVRRFGPLRFDELVELALYHDEVGFYGRGGHAGRGGDFITSPEVGPLFGTVLARALDTWWDELHRPDPFVVVEAGAGAGTLARAVLAARPACASALRYVLVERSAVLRRRQEELLSLEPARLALGPAGPDDPDLGRLPVAGLGPLVTALGELPAGPFTGVVLANELLDNLAFRLLERTGDGWAEVRVGERLDEVVVPAEADLVAEARRLVPDAAPGARIPIQHQAQAWLRHALAALQAGRVVVVDYADATASLAQRPWTTWVRTYRAHGRGGHPLEHLGEQDVTCEVAVDQLAHVRARSADRSQAEFLRAHGLDALVADARDAWLARAGVGDLEALKHRSRIAEAQALGDPTGLGAFRVLEWEVR
jgi:NADH dehydrogenase [ubiquinone] 1 alpha subcomplex assembly factor 7